MIRTVGVTGTNGKTTTTTLVAAALARLARPVACVTTVGFRLDDEVVTDLRASHVGFLQLMKRLTDGGGRFAAVEYTSEALAHGYARKWPAEIGVFTNLTHDHLDAHGSPEHYLASKAQLFVSLPEGGAAVMNAGDASSTLIEEVIPAGVRVLRYSVPSRGEAEADLRATTVELSWKGTKVSLVSSIEGVPSVISVRAIGEVFAENALGALGAAIAAGVPPASAADAIAGAAPPPGRFQVVAQHPFVVVDYAHSPDALARTLASARKLCAGRLQVVFGAGGDRDENKRAPMGDAASIADRVVLTTDNPRDEDPALIAAAIRDGVRTDVETILDRARAIETAVRDAGPDDVVVIAGKGHERTQTASGKVVPFDDAAAAMEAWNARG
jgi:UDP-N-acetylmuramoyl-L-alanyl-D-glutamate--2,6-diaminopimelate ligase